MFDTTRAAQHALQGVMVQREQKRLGAKQGHTDGGRRPFVSEQRAERQADRQRRARGAARRARRRRGGERRGLRPGVGRAAADGGMGGGVRVWEEEVKLGSRRSPRSKRKRRCRAKERGRGVKTKQEAPPARPHPGAGESRRPPDRGGASPRAARAGRPPPLCARLGVLGERRGAHTVRAHWGPPCTRPLAPRRLPGSAGAQKIGNHLKAGCQPAACASASVQK